MSEKISKIVLGTSRFSGIYGIKNNKKKLSLKEVKKIIDYAYKNKIRYLDTAIAYKKTNHLLKKINIKRFKVTSKLPSIKLNTNNIYYKISKIIDDHLEQLRIKRLYALYLHRPDDLLKKNNENLILALKKLKKEKKIKKVGFSVYGVKQLKNLINVFKPDIVQLPLSVFDYRFKKKNIIKKLQDMKVEVHVRSIFFQGGLFCNYKTLNKKLLFTKKIYSKWRNWLQKNNTNITRGAFSVLYKLKKVKVVVGVESRDQLIEINNEFKKKFLKPPQINISNKILGKLYKNIIN